jgi:hypothetical protein
MKTFSHLFLILLIVVGLLGPTAGWASETRVDSTGGLTTILDDETTDLDLFLDGNPAGLVLLNTKDRLDLSGEWSYTDQEGPWGANKQQIFTTIPRYTDGPIKYEGLMLFPDPHWAVQVLGDAFVNQGVPFANYTADTETSSQYRGLVRAAYALPFGALGLEIEDVGIDDSFDPGLYNPNVGLASGSDSQNQVLVKGGFITTFPGPSSAEDPRWQAGGYFQSQVGTAPLERSLSLFYLNSPSFTVSQTNSTIDYTDWAAELYYVLPSVAKVRFSVSLINSDNEFQQTVPFTSADFSNLTKYHSDQYQSMVTTGAFKLRLPFSDTESLDMGGFISGFFNNQDVLRTTGTVSDDKDRQQIGTAFGIGLDSPKEYTMGLQWKSLSYAINTDLINNPGTTSSLAGTDYSYYQLAFGGEKWISPTWAFRLGLVGEIDDYSSTSISTLTTTINAGLGIEEVFGRVDGRVWLGQAGDLNNASNTVGLVGAQLYMTLFL